MMVAGLQLKTAAKLQGTLRRFSEAYHAYEPGFYLLLAAIIIMLIGIMNQYGGLNLGGFADNLLRDFYSNLSTELFSITVTLYIVERAIRRHERRQRKELQERSQLLEE